jgi:hypothetical protein
MENAVKSKPLSQGQLMVWQVVKNLYSERDLDDLRELLLDFNNLKMQEHLDETVAQKGYTEVDFEKMLNGHDRKSR